MVGNMQAHPQQQVAYGPPANESSTLEAAILQPAILEAAISAREDAVSKHFYEAKTPQEEEAAKREVDEADARVDVLQRAAQQAAQRAAQLDAYETALADRLAAENQWLYFANTGSENSIARRNLDEAGARLEKMIPPEN